MSQLRIVFSGLAQSCTKPTTVPKPPEISRTDLMRATRSSGVPIVATAPEANAVLSTASSGLPKGRALERRCELLVVVGQEPAARLGAGLLARLRDVPAQEAPPVLPVDGLPVLG